MVKFVEINVKSVLTRQRFRDNWFWNRYTINPYRGCQFACNYCDAITEKYLVHEDYRDFSRVIYVKKNCVEVLKKQVRKAKPDVVALSGVTDPYQPAEKKYELTRKVLEVLAENSFPVNIGTKGDLVLRDMDILKEISEKTWCSVSFTIITFNRDLLRHFEPYAPPPEKRLKAIEKLRSEGIEAGVNFIPIIPFFLDSKENLEEVISKVSGRAGYVLIGSGMTLRSNQRIRFMELLKRNFPSYVEKYLKLYGDREHPPPSYLVKINREAYRLCKKYGIKNYIPPPSYPRPFKENFDVSFLLLQIAFFKEFRTGNPYSAWAYHRASENIERLNTDIRKLYMEGKIDEIPGVGESIRKTIEEYLAEGKSSKLKKEMGEW